MKLKIENFLKIKKQLLDEYISYKANQILDVQKFQKEIL